MTRKGLLIGVAFVALLTSCKEGSSASPSTPANSKAPAAASSATVAHPAEFVINPGDLLDAAKFTEYMKWKSSESIGGAVQNPPVDIRCVESSHLTMDCTYTSPAQPSATTRYTTDEAGSHLTSVTHVTDGVPGVITPIG